MFPMPTVEFESVVAVMLVPVREAKVGFAVFSTDCGIEIMYDN